MKKRIGNFVYGAGLAALVWGPLLMAQISETAEIPFDFQVGRSALPAGTYSVTKAAGIRSGRPTGKRNGEEGRTVGNDLRSACDALVPGAQIKEPEHDMS